MTTTTDLLRRAAGLPEHASRLLPGMQDANLVRKRVACKPTAASLLALADQMERAPFDMQEFEDLLEWYADCAYNDQK